MRICWDVFKGVANRSVFVIDRNGKIAHKWVSDDPRVQPNHDEIKAKAKTLSDGA